MTYKSLYSFVIIVSLWMLLHISVDSAIIPSPLTTGARMMTLFFPVLLPHLLASLGRVLIAVISTMVVAIPIGIALGRYTKVDKIITPVIYSLYPVPKIAFLPILMIFFGIGNTSKILLLCLVIVFQLIVSTRDSVRKIEKELYYSIESLGASTRQLYQHMIIPAILPNLLTALKISTGSSLSVLFFAENYATTKGLGYFIMDSWMKLSYVDMFTGIVMMSLLGIALFKFIEWIEKRFCSWIFIASKGI